MKPAVLTFIAIVMSCVVFAQHSKTDILTVLHNQEIAWNEGNIDEFMDGYWKSDSLLFIGSKGASYGWQRALDNYKKGYPDKDAMGILSFDIKEVKMLSNEFAFVAGKWNLERKAGDVGGYFTLLFRKIGDRWFIIADHTS